MSKRIIDWTLSVLASGVAFALSWPFWRNFEYWAESRTAWWIYFILGYLLSVYVFYVFIACTRMLFLHESLIKEGVIKPGETLEEKPDQEDKK